MNRYLDIAPEVQEALANGKPVVALESTIISHGMPYPQNVKTALQVEKIIRENGAVPATIAVIGGRMKAGLTAEEITLTDASIAALYHINQLFAAPEAEVVGFAPSFTDMVVNVNMAGMRYVQGPLEGASCREDPEALLAAVSDKTVMLYLDNPNNRHPLDTLDAFDMARKYMLDGLPWDYGTGKKDEKGIIKIIDWENPENNTFEFVENWQGALNDGFGWDFILCINAIPLCGIVIEKSSETLQSALDMAQYQLDNDFQFPVYCHALVISDGEKILIGDPWLELDGFQEIGTLKEALRPVDFLVNRIKTIPE